jgi:hypothetical protein
MRGHCLETSHFISKVNKICWRKCRLYAVCLTALSPDYNEPIRIPEWEWLKENSIAQSKDSGTGRNS